jgi:enamine deaminase RidA (YjgF/YER057c/UK114 family)
MSVRQRNSTDADPEKLNAPEHVTSMTWYLTDRRDYLARLRHIGDVYRQVMGRHFPAMTVVEVAGLMEEKSKSRDTSDRGNPRMIIERDAASEFAGTTSRATSRVRD